MVFEGLKVDAAVQNSNQCYYLVYDEQKKSYHLDVTRSFFQEGGQNWIQRETRTCAINVRHE